MNYPIWQLGFPGGLLIAAVAVLHVFISHFAVGGGAYLVLTERRAYAGNDAELLAYVKHHSKFFALLTVVLGAVTGVGIWFTIGLVSPEATSSLIHTFVWGWAIEWVFFFVEIAAALIYAYQWDRLDRETHLIVGWIYFVAAWASLVVINGIITYMLTPGRWLETGNFWAGFFNPTYWPSLFIRSAMAVALPALVAGSAAGRAKAQAKKLFSQTIGQQKSSLRDPRTKVKRFREWMAEAPSKLSIFLGGLHVCKEALCAFGADGLTCSGQRIRYGPEQQDLPVRHHQREP